MLRKYFFKALIGASIIYLIDFILFFPMYTNQTFNDNTTLKKNFLNNLKCVINLEDKFSQNLLLILNSFEWIPRMNIYS